MRSKRFWPAPAAAVVVIALTGVVVACGNDDADSTSRPASTTQSSRSGNATDAGFITDMTAHHQGAIDMAKLAQKDAEHAGIRQMADEIIAAQQAEIAVMKRVSDDLEQMGEQSSGHMGMSDSEMGMDMDMGDLENAKPFDKAFIDAMVPHHEGAIAMAKAELAKGRQPALREMAQDIIDAQTKEIEQMRDWRKSWYGSAGSSGHSVGGGSGHDMGDDEHMDMDG
jgi:uncharacterized protein (DUF305 family)